MNRISIAFDADHYHVGSLTQLLSQANAKIIGLYEAYNSEDWETNGEELTNAMSKIVNVAPSAPLDHPDFSMSCCVVVMDVDDKGLEVIKQSGHITILQS